MMLQAKNLLEETPDEILFSIKQLQTWSGALVLVSQGITFLNVLCNKIWTLDN